MSKNKLLDLLNLKKDSGRGLGDDYLDAAIALVEAGETRSLTVAIKGCTGVQMIDHLCIPLPVKPHITDYDRALAALDELESIALNSVEYVGQANYAERESKALSDVRMAFAKKRAELDGNE